MEAWIPCHCGDFWCRIHGTHAHDCSCPPIEAWSVDPYHEGGPMRDDVLLLRVTQLTTTRADLTEQEGVFVILQGRVVGPLESILALVRAQHDRQPTVAIAVRDDLDDG